MSETIKLRLYRQWSKAECVLFSTCLRGRTRCDRCVVNMSITSHLQAKRESDQRISDAQSEGSSVWRLQQVSPSRISSTTLSVETSPA